jgi:hypothetical protein
MIPKIIWQTYDTNYKDLPEHFKRSSLTWKNLNQGYEYIYCNEAERRELVKNTDSLLLQYYKLASPIVQADIWRYITIYNNGGFYADIDSICISPIDYFLKNFYTGQPIITRGNGNRFANDYRQDISDLESSNFGAVKNHPAFKEMINSAMARFKNMTIEQIAQNINVLWLDNFVFSDNILKYKKDVCFNFLKSSFHYGSQGKFNDYKYSFDENFIVDYFGEKILYPNLCIKNGWEC